MGKKLIDVPYIDQTKDWPTGCESVSTVMLLQYLGIEIEMDEFVDKYLEKEPFEEIDGTLFGADPRVRFAGEPADPDSMGCYAPVIVKALNKVLNQYALMAYPDAKAVNLTEVPMETLLTEYIDNDMPVIFWASIDLLETIPGPDWVIRETGEPFSWVSNEHCMLLVGYDDTKYYFNDPWHNHGVIGYDKELVEMRHKEQYSMAVSIQ